MVHKLNYLTVDWSLKYDTLFPTQQPLIVEIGFGTADYLIHLAQTRPDYNIIGFEISSQSMEKAERKIESLGLTNVRPIHGTGETALAHLLEPESVAEFHINYPDPWFKKKHHGRRLIKRETVDMLTSRLVIGGTVMLATDIRDYADMAHGILSDTIGLSNTFDSAWMDDLPERFRTKYEMKGYREGRNGHFFIYQRNNTAINHPPVIKDLEMPHLFLTSPLNTSEIIDHFEQTRTETNGVHIAILQAYANPKRDTAVFEVVVEEHTIEQHCILTLTPRDEANTYIVQMSSIGRARPTYGLHRAVETLGEWVVSLHEDAHITETKLRE